MCMPMLTLAAANFAFTVETSGEERISFNRQIRPLLSDRCWTCHGPDEKNRKGRLRLDTRDGALASKDGRAIIAPGRPEQSELIKRIVSNDPDEKMPPPESHLSLSDQEIELLREWIAQGAEWEKHWAFIPAHKSEPPAVPNRAWARNTIDRFVLAKLEEAGLAPAPEAGRERLIRRLAFDLTGLPPTPAQVEAFVNDSSPDAWEKVVDQFLGAKAFGEHMAVSWLDIARYSDTHGYQADRYRAMWPWRDWVIKAFNENMPYDQFVTWQLAGDLLPKPTKEQMLATAFNRHHMQTEEGGSVEEEFRVSYVVDRVNTVGTAFLALTLDCSRCHDHKYDPVSQKDFYEMFALFQNIDESGQTSHFTDSMPVPTLLLSTDEQDQRLAELKKRIAEKEQNEAALRENARPAFEEWLAGAPAFAKIEGLQAAIDFEEIKDKKAANSANGNKPASAVEAPVLVEGGAKGKAAELNGENGFVLNGLGEFSRVDPFTIGVWVRTPSLPKRAVVFHRSMAALDAASRGYEMLIENGRVSLGLHHMWPGNAIKIMSKAGLPTNEWVHLTMTYDGASRAAGLKLYWNGKLAETDTLRDNLWKDISYERGSPQLTIGHRFRDNGFRDGQVDEFRIYNRALSPLEVRQLHGDREIGAEDASPAELFEFYLARHNPIFRKHLSDLRELRAELSRLINPIPEVMVMQEMAMPKPAFVLKRGAYDAPGDPLSADVPEAVMEFGPDRPRNRLGFAQWLFAPEHPLTARVAANRLWQTMFGRGLVGSADNFGSQGDLPTHPELLDWLAIDFRESGWDVKRFLRNIALSATYRQSSQPSLDALAKDPENKLLSRARSYRLPAEALRDQALMASGLLASQIGGPPVKPYQPDGLWEEKSGARYERDKGDALYRRSLYTFHKRTSPPPSMVSFDAAERNVCIVQRQVTSTPLQALALLNDPQLAEASRFLAERMFKEGGADLDAQLAFLFRTLTSRAARPAELAVLKKAYQEQHDIFSKQQQETLKLLMVGDKASDPAIPPAQLAAGAMVASALLNHDETITRR